MPTVELISELDAFSKQQGYSLDTLIVMESVHLIMKELQGCTTFTIKSMPHASHYKVFYTTIERVSPGLQTAVEVAHVLWKQDAFRFPSRILEWRARVWYTWARWSCK